jgi:hypothetical protein
MLSGILSTPANQLERRNEKYFRILTLLSVPALGFLSAGAAYLGFFKLESSWPFLVLPPSLLVVGLVLFEGVALFPAKENQPWFSLKMANRAYLIVMVYFILASVGWLYYLVKFIEIHK